MGEEGRTKPEAESPPSAPAADDAIGCWRVLLDTVLTLALLAACVGGPLLAGRWLHPWAGMGVGGGALVVWVHFGPRPMPGLLPGALAVSGLAAIIAAMVVCALWLAQ